MTVELALQWRKNLIRAGVPEKNIETFQINVFRRSAECYRYVRVYCRSLAEKLILTATDGLAYNLIDAFALEGMQPGRDFQLISCGNREGQGFRFMADPVITSVDPMEATVTREAVKLLMMKIENFSACDYIVRIPSGLAVRKSFNREP